MSKNRSSKSELASSSTLNGGVDSPNNLANKLGSNSDHNISNVNISNSHNLDYENDLNETNSANNIYLNNKLNEDELINNQNDEFFLLAVKK